ncbi:uncharacterized protein LOC134531476 [Bacillus rossius redtenbacheri]|uniref:uncharacterized protein LOC134531476 n=1 Tax=Bacillus rossius redtenbacheri TaxID=93214 RepID=UPI002FDDD584
MSEEEVIKLVQAVEKFPVIYNYSMAGHSNKDELDKAWREISTEIGFNVDVCKEKWRNCRNCWARHLRQTEASGSGAKPKKPYYLSEYLSFLTPFTKSRRQSGNLASAFDNGEPFSQSEDECDANDRSSDASVMSPPEQSTAQKKSKRTDKQNPIDSAFVSYLEARKRRCEAEPEHPDLLFLKSLLPDISKLSPSQKSHFKISVQQKLHNMLYESPASEQNHTVNYQPGQSASSFQFIDYGQSRSASNGSPIMPPSSNGIFDRSFNFQ